MSDDTIPREQRSIQVDAICLPKVVVTVIVEVVDNEGMSSTKVEQLTQAYPDPTWPVSDLRGLLTVTTAELVEEIVEHVDRAVQRTAWGR